MTVKVYCVGTMPDELLAAWSQHLRNFDMKHAHCHFQVTAVGGNLSAEAIRLALENVDPPFDIVIPTKQ